MSLNQYELAMVMNLERLRDNWQPVAGLVYRGPADFVLQHGNWYRPRPLPPEINPFLPNICFANAINCAVEHGLEYVEGFAVGLYPHQRPAMIHHAWNLKDGKVVDVTWCGRREREEAGWKFILPFENSLVGLAYCGVTFRVERADDANWEGDANILDDHHRGWPLLRQKWTGEPDPCPFPYTERLRMVRDHDLEAFKKWEQENREAWSAPSKHAIAVDLITGEVLH